MRNHKKILSLALAGVMTLALAVPAFASGATSSDTTTATTGTSGNMSTEVTANYTSIPIKVSVPSAATAMINPYGLPVTISAIVSGGSDTTISGWKIVSQPSYITNEGNVKLSVSAKVTTALASGCKATMITTSADKVSATEQEIFAQLQVAQVPSGSTITGYTGTSAADWAVGLADADKDALNKAFGTDATWTSAKSLTLSTDDVVSMADMGTLEAVASAASDSQGTVTTPAHYAAGSIALFRISGAVTEDPETAWTTTDGFTATVAFSFKPASST
jgi:hypothetical protein